MVKTCTSCNMQVGSDFIEFKCPQCSKHKIVRCMHCRTTARSYKCPDCQFMGP